ncbi:hypothetical protein BHE74_00009849 [Ensete ventricosum]|nr:hypothetical protein BHE74_00009849 [Ensete ventricosum]
MYPSVSKMVEVVRWSDTEARARRLGDCGDYDGDLYREDPLDSVGAFGNIIVVDNLPVMPPENFAKLEGVVRMMYNQEMEDSRALFSSNIQVINLNLECGSSSSSQDLALWYCAN